MGRQRKTQATQSQICSLCREHAGSQKRIFTHMDIKYTSPPTENRFFNFSATDVSGVAKFEAYLNGKLLWSEECPNPPFHEQLRLPDGLAGNTLLIVGSDDKEEQELMFFINDD